MNDRESRSIHMKFQKQDDKLLDFVMSREKITNQTEGIRRALKCYHDNSEQVQLLKEMVENQNEIKNLLKEILFRGNGETKE